MPSFREAPEPRGTGGGESIHPALIFDRESLPLKYHITSGVWYSFLIAEMVVQTPKRKAPFGLEYLEWIPRIEDFADKIRRWHFDKSVIEPIAYLIITLLLTGLVWFIFYVDGKNTMPPSPPGEDEHKSDADADYDFNNLIKKQQEPDETLVMKGSTDKYDWQQTMTEIDVFVPLPDEAQLSRKQVWTMLNMLCVLLTIRCNDLLLPPTSTP